VTNFDCFPPWDGKDGRYRLRMDSALIERVAALAEKRNALVFLDVQVGLSNLRDELPRLAGFLSRPNFHLGIEPGFAGHSSCEVPTM
jgi:hypothetical protein